MAKVNHKIKLNSTESGHYYTTVKNSKNKPEKMECLKYDPTLRRRVKYKEGKVK